jgi:hypothetical protein
LAIDGGDLGATGVDQPTVALASSRRKKGLWPRWFLTVIIFGRQVLTGPSLMGGIELGASGGAQVLGAA